MGKMMADYLLIEDADSTNALGKSNGDHACSFYVPGRRRQAASSTGNDARIVEAPPRCSVAASQVPIGF